MSYLYLKYGEFTAVERNVSCKLAMWKRVLFVSRMQTKGVPFLSEWCIKRKGVRPQGGVSPCSLSKYPWELCYFDMLCVNP